MGMTYDELSTFGRLRKTEKLGPVSLISYKKPFENPELSS